MGNFGLVLLYKGELNEAEKVLEQSVELSKQYYSEGYLIYPICLALTHARQGKIKQAIEEIRDHELSKMKHSTGTYICLLVSIVEIYWRAKKIKEVNRYMSEAKEEMERIGFASTTLPHKLYSEMAELLWENRQ